MTEKPILLVENEEDEAVLLRHTLQKARVLNPVQVVSTVEDAICYLKGEGQYGDREKFPFPILIFVDLHLCGRSGFEVLDWLGRNRGARPPAVVVLTGSDINAVKKSYDRGADSFLVKPLKLEDLKNTVRHVRGIELHEADEGYRLKLS